MEDTDACIDCGEVGCEVDHDPEATAADAAYDDAKYD